MIKKAIPLMIFLSLNIFACDANCVACHPVLIKNGSMDSDHKILNNCVQCHIENKEEESHGSCGADCWSCHDIKKVSKIDIPEHKILKKCIKCHIGLDKQFFNLQNTESAFENNFLKDSI